MDLRGRNMKMTDELTRKRLLPIFFDSISWDRRWLRSVRMLCASKYDLEVFAQTLSHCLLPRFPFVASLWHLSLSLSLFLSALFFCPLFLSLWRADGGQLGCDPITDWLQQSPSADWFYNPRSRSQMGENQLVKKHCAAIKLHAGTHTRTDTRQHTRIEAHPLSWYRYCLCLVG